MDSRSHLSMMIRTMIHIVNNNNTTTSTTGLFSTLALTSRAGALGCMDIAPTGKTFVVEAWRRSCK